MLDLDKISKKLKEVLASQTKESLEKWFPEDETDEICSFGSVGEPLPESIIYCLTPDSYTFDANENDNVGGEYAYAMAA